MTLADLIIVNNINNIEVICPDPDFPNTLDLALRISYDCAGKELIMDSPMSAKAMAEVAGLYLRTDGVLQIVLKPYKRK